MRTLLKTIATCTLAAISLNAQGQDESTDFSSFAAGPYQVETVSIDERSGSPAQMDVYLPNTEEDVVLPLVYMNHGFLVQNQFYSKILTRIASHGFAVIAPQMYGRSPLPFGKPSLTNEANLGIRIISWAQTNLGDLVGRQISSDQLALMGHSRGGQVSWNIAARSSLTISGIIGLDPVDGNRRDAITDSALASVPSLTIGAGLGGSCAPEGRNYKNFFGATDKGLDQWLVIGENFGHMDLLDQDCGIPCLVCRKAGANFSRDNFITAVAGSTTAFLKKTLRGNQTMGAEIEAFFAMDAGYTVITDAE